MEAVYSSETSVSSYRTTQCYNSEDKYLNNNGRLFMCLIICCLLNDAFNVSDYIHLTGMMIDELWIVSICNEEIVV
jgi:hypothetical protein